MSDVGFELLHYSTGHLGASGGLSVYGLAILTTFSPGLLFIPFAFTNRALRPASTIVLSFGLGYVLFLSMFDTTFARNVLPALPALAVVIGLGISTVESKDRAAGQLRLWTVYSTCLIALAVPAGVSIRDLANMEDRSEAMTWIADNVPEGARLEIESSSPWVDPERYDINSRWLMVLEPPDDGWEYLFLTGKGSLRFERQADSYPLLMERIDDIRASSCLVQDFPGVVEIRAASC